MAIQSTPIEELIKDLPPASRVQVREFIQILIKKRSQKNGKGLQQKWAGALSDLRDQYTSLELEQKALDWRGE